MEKGVVRPGWWTVRFWVRCFKRWLKQSLCRHKWEKLVALPPGETNGIGWFGDVWECEKCRKPQIRRTYIPPWLTSSDDWFLPKEADPSPQGVRP